MRMIMNLSFPIEPFNEIIRNGKAGEVIGKILDAVKPETIYFTEQDGYRGAVAVVQVNEASDIPRLAEPWFLGLEAECTFRIAMTPEDLQKSGIDKIGKEWA
jgi:hypothetical protein